MAIDNSINLAIHPGEVCAMTGASGSGKTHIATALGVQAIEHHRKRVSMGTEVSADVGG